MKMTVSTLNVRRASERGHANHGWLQTTGEAGVPGA
jgi:hypothetical protein